MSADWAALVAAYGEEPEPDGGAPVEAAAEDRKPWPVEVVEAARDEAKIIAEQKEQADEDARALRRERARRNAKMKLDAEALDDGSGTAVLESFHDGAVRDIPDEEWTVAGLLGRGGRTVFSAFRKAGKTTMALNLVRSLSSGEPFLGKFEVAPLPDDDSTVLWLNVELTRDQADRWMRRLGGHAQWGHRARALHLRGSLARFNIIEDGGRERLIAEIRRARARRIIVDPVGPWVASCGLENSLDTDVSTFLNAFNRIASICGVEEIIYIHHVGKRVEDGKEGALGSIVWENTADSIWVMGKEQESERRWFRAEGRDVEVPECTIVLAEDGITLTVDDGTRNDLAVDAVLMRLHAYLRDVGPQNTTTIRKDPRLSGKTALITSAVAEGVRRGIIRKFQDGSSVMHEAV